MSKSLGNFYTVRQLLKEGWHGETIRLALLKAHYRQPLNFSLKALSEAKSELDRLYGALRTESSDDICDQNHFGPDRDVQSALENDLNTPEALSKIHSLASSIYQVSEDSDLKMEVRGRLRVSASLLGLLQVDPEIWFRSGSVSQVGLFDDLKIEDLIDRRNKARAERDFQKADEIRDVLAAENIHLEDGPHGTRWKRG
jgi:cysteinyl-tRNA synthetase